MASYGWFRICPKCFRKYGRHFEWCIDCSPRAKRERDGAYPTRAHRTRYGIFLYGDKVHLNFCNSKKLPLDKRLEICAKCKVRFKCYTQADDDYTY